MRKQEALLTKVGIIFAVLVITGCAASTRRSVEPERLGASARPAYSIAAQQPDMTVAVSPVRQTMQIGGSIPALLGAGISAIQDGQNAAKIQQVLGEYDCGAVFAGQVRAGLEKHFGAKLHEVRPFTTAAGFHNARDAREARMEGLQKSGHDLVLDFDLSYGIYGAEGLLATRIRGEIAHPESGKILWRRTLTRYSVDLYADMRWRDPMERLTPRYFSPRLLTADDAIAQWTSDGGDHLKKSFEQSVQDTVAAILTDLGLEETAEGRYVLGIQDLLEGRYEDAETQLSRAVALAPDSAAAANGLAMAQARSDKMKEALNLAEKTAVAHSEYLPVQYNLAWWYAVDLKSPDKARPYFDKAVSLGASPGRRLKKAMGAS